MLPRRPYTNYLLSNVAEKVCTCLVRKSCAQHQIQETSKAVLQHAHLLAELWPDPWEAASSSLREPVREKRLLPPSCLLMLVAVRLVGTVARVPGSGAVCCIPACQSWVQRTGRSHQTGQSQT